MTALFSLFFLFPSSSKAALAVMEQTRTSRNTLFVDTTNARLDISTQSYGGKVPAVGLYSSSNAVISSSNGDNCVIYATGSVSCQSLTGNTVNISSGTTLSTTTISPILYVNGEAIFTDPTTNVSVIYASGPATSQQTFQLNAAQGFYGLYSYNQGTYPLGFAQTQSGNVGFGTASPCSTCTLQVAGNISSNATVQMATLKFNDGTTQTTAVSGAATLSANQTFTGVNTFSNQIIVSTLTANNPSQTTIRNTWVVPINPGSGGFGNLGASPNGIFSSTFTANFFFSLGQGMEWMLHYHQTGSGTANIHFFVDSTDCVSTFNAGSGGTYGFLSEMMSFYDSSHANFSGRAADGGGGSGIHTNNTCSFDMTTQHVITVSINSNNGANSFVIDNATWVVYQ